MPISENDYSLDATDDHFGSDSIASSTTSTMSKAEIRKTHKPIMEKRRRAKINNCLNEIKDLILTAMKKDPERHSKLEKADILEMAVKHLKTIQKQQKEIAIRSDPNLAIKYKSGYLECATEVTQYVDQMDGVEPGLKHRLTNHLNKCAGNIDQPQFPNFTSSSLLASFAAQSRFNKTDDQNNNARSLQSMQGIELIPSCLPNGDFAFLVPKASFNSILNSTNNTLANNAETERPSAFVTVTPRMNQPGLNGLCDANGLLKISKPLSPPMSPELPKPFQNPVKIQNSVQIIKPKAEKLMMQNSLAHGHVHGHGHGADVNMEIQSIKFPIQKKELVSEPLCIITNNGERYRQAQQVEESRHNEENDIYFGLGRSGNAGIKRKAKDGGLLTVAPQVKFAKVEKLEMASSCPSAFRKLSTVVMKPQQHHQHQHDIYETDDSSDSTSNSRPETQERHNHSDQNKFRQDGNEDNDDNDKNESMWRPW